MNKRIGGREIAIPEGVEILWSPANSAWLVLWNEHLLRVIADADELKDYVEHDLGGRPLSYAVDEYAMMRPNALEPIENAWARRAEKEVRRAFKKYSRMADFRIPAKTIDENVVSSWLELPGNRSGWTSPDPFKVLVFTESGNFRDPFSSERLMRYWEKVVEALRDNPWHEDAGWESVNQAVQYIWIAPLLVA